MAVRASDRVNSALSKHGYTQLRKVGEGSFGAAILCQDKSDAEKDSKAIVKMIDISRATKQERDDALKESRVLSQLRHPYIVRYRENFLEDGWLCIVMDYCEGGDLSDRIKRMRSQRKSFPEEQVLRWFTQAILALKYIHDMKILHRDLQSGNFFLSKSGNLKMGDFGIAKVLECTAACAQTQIGTPYYLSPEICSGKPYSWGSDIWSMGCILYELTARKVPFDAPDLKSLIRKITSGAPPDVPSEYSVGLRNLFKEMLSRNPDDRPQAQDVLKRPVVQEVVRRMLDEVKGDEENEGKDGEKAPGGGSAPSAARSASGGGRTAGDSTGNYVKNDNVEYYSETHKEWLPAVITNTDPDGRIMLNVKPNVWLGLEVQSAKVRLREDKGGSQENASAADRGARGGSNGRPPPSGGAGPANASPARRSEERRRSPAGGARQPSADGMRRQNSRDGLPRQEAERYPTPGARRPSGGGRDPSPRGGGGRQATPDRGSGVPPAGGAARRQPSGGRR